MARSKVRESIAGQALIGNVEFWATSATPIPSPRRIMQYTGVGVDGAVTEDLGQNARIETLTATVDEDIYSALDKLKKAAKVLMILHPLFGAFEGRILDVVPQAGPDDMVDITVTLVEHGKPVDIFVTPVKTTASAKQATASAYANLGLGALNNLPTSTGLPAASAGMSSGFASFSAVMDSVDSADGLWADVSAAYSELAQAGDILIDAIDAFEDATDDMIDMVDVTYEVLNTARDYVGAMEQQFGTVWQNLLITRPLSLAEIALDLMGDASDDTIQLILDRNPTIIDICAVPIGLEISIPVAL